MGLSGITYSAFEFTKYEFNRVTKDGNGRMIYVSLLDDSNHYSAFFVTTAKNQQ